MQKYLTRSAGASAFEALQNNRNAELLWCLPGRDDRPLAASWRVKDLSLIERSIEEIRFTYHISGSTRIVNFTNGECVSSDVKSRSIAVTGPGTFEWKIHGEVTFAQAYFWIDRKSQSQTSDGASMPSLRQHAIGVRDSWLAGFFAMFLSYLPHEAQRRRHFIESMASIVLKHLGRRYSADCRELRRARISKNGGLSAEALANVQEYAGNNLISPVSIKDLADMAGWSESHFFRAFKQSTGSTPYQYLKELRLQAAQEYLGDGQLTIGEVAGRVGFPDAAQFSTAFGKRFGLTPSAFRLSLTRRASKWAGDPAADI